MREFVDLRGASGQTYRFRKWVGGTCSPTAGNYAVLREAGDGFEVVMMATTNDLSRPPGTVQAAIGKRDLHIYARLNITRSVREAEDEDITAHYGARHGVGDKATGDS